jgi:hypothetical protein
MIIKAIGDPHGSPFWKEMIKDIDNVDKIIFLGDYLDPYQYNYYDTIENFKEIIALKRQYPDKVDLLKGNHCLHYIYNADKGVYPCTRYMFQIENEIKKLYKDNLELFVNCVQYDKYLFLHAGITQIWFDQVFKGDSSISYTEQFNNPSTIEKEKALYTIGRMRGGRDIAGGIFWADIEELFNSPLEDKSIIQVVGHNRVYDIVKKENIWFIDCQADNIDHPHLTIEI